VSGNAVSLKKDAQVEVTVAADAEATQPAKETETPSKS